MTQNFPGKKQLKNHQSTWLLSYWIVASATWLLVLILTYRAKNDFKTPAVAAAKPNQGHSANESRLREPHAEDFPTEFWQEDRYFPDETVLNSPPPYYLYNYSTQASLEMVQPSPSSGGSGGSFDQRSHD